MKKVVLFFALLLFLIPVPVTAEEPTQTVVDYIGELVDQNAAPISGVLPLEFRVYSSEKSKKPMVTEKHFIAVVDGGYAVSLGEQKPIKTTKSELYVAVFLDGKELTRQKVSTQKQLILEDPKIITTETAGSQNQDAFKLECPAGYVMTGIEGSIKGGMKSLKAVCAKTI